MSIDVPTHLRFQPLEPKGTLRVENILDAAAELIDEVGYGALTISMIAKRCEMSGPGIYRYFVDLTAIARALAARNLSRFFERVEELLDDDADWEVTLRTVVRAYCDLMRLEPGFRWLRLGDSVDRYLISSKSSNRLLVAQQTAALFVQRYDVDYRADLVEHVEVIVELCDALVGRAFQANPQGDEFFIDECAEIAVTYLGIYLAKPHLVVKHSE
jgi:AcrR family transcriptional regulator